jgi:hypothetical protein
MTSPFIPVYDFLTRLDRRQFIRYMLISLGIIGALSIGIVIQLYRSTTSFKKRIGRLNQYREQTQEILQRAHDVATQRAAVNELLAEDVDFKIGGYFNELVASLNLTNKKKGIDTLQTIERTDNYLEQNVTAKFVDMNMKELTTLLVELENNPRIFVRELEIKRAEKTPGTIEVTLIIATLLPTTSST